MEKKSVFSMEKLSMVEKSDKCPFSKLVVVVENFSNDICVFQGFSSYSFQLSRNLGDL